jgi:class 3 adenylate cyclase
MTDTSLIVDESESPSVQDENFGEAVANEKPRNAVGDELPAMKGRKAARTLKFLILFALFAVSCLVAWGAYDMGRSRDKTVFKDNYYDMAKRVIDDIHQRTSNRLWVAVTLSLEFATHARSSQLEWPNVTMDHFDLRNIGNLQMAGADSVTFSPLLQKDQISDWQSYADSVDPSVSSLAQYGNLSSNTYGLAVPIWQISPETPENLASRLTDVLDVRFCIRCLNKTIETKRPTISKVMWFNGKPFNSLISPVINEKGDEVVGIVSVMSRVDHYFDKILHKVDNPVFMVLETECGDTLSFEVMNEEAVYLGPGDQHNEAFDDWEVNINLDGIYSEFLNSIPESQSKSRFEYAVFHPNPWDTDGHARNASLQGCPFNVRMYPTDRFEEAFTSTWPIVYLALVGVLFLLNMLLFLAYDKIVERRQRQLIDSAARSNEIVNSLFPTVVRTRVFRRSSSVPEPQQKQLKKRRSSFLASEHILPKIMPIARRNSGRSNESFDTFTNEDNDEPIAEFFSECTIMFADIVGFTAWSADREPKQVFELLENVYSAFDRLAKKFDVFKVETVGDCYVAVAGLPEKDPQHAVTITRFARAMQKAMSTETKELEIRLGPGTSDLTLRIGLHSGSVTGGVLRGDKSRFQLFGDTMNTAARMESTGLPDCIQMSERTANLLKASGKENWILRREEPVLAKGKGEMVTYLIRNSRRDSSTTDFSDRSDPEQVSTSLVSPSQSTHLAQATLHSVCINEKKERAKRERLVDWMTDVLKNLLCKAIDSRQAREINDSSRHSVEKYLSNELLQELEQAGASCAKRPESARHESAKGAQQVALPWEIRFQLNQYVTAIADLYESDLPYHSFEHASHVALSAHKLLSLVEKTGSGIDADPFIQFTLILAALVHNVRHPGVSNKDLVLSQSPLAIQYHNESVAEKYAVDTALSLLKEVQFRDLCEAIAPTEADWDRFSHLLTRLVLATDLEDSNLHEEYSAQLDSVEEFEVEKVAEIILVASHMSHAMQHWVVYFKWSEHRFHEEYQAFARGFTKRDPRFDWYQSQLEYFDTIVIPVARKLRDCDCLGSASETYLTFARDNRQEWKLKGVQMSKVMLDRQVLRQSADSKLRQIPAAA